MNALKDAADFENGNFTESVEDQLIRDEEAHQPTDKDVHTVYNKLRGAIIEKAYEFLANYNVFDAALSKLAGNDVLPVIVEMVLAGTLDKKAAISAITRQAHQVSAAVFYEIVRRERREALEDDKRRMPTPDAASMSPRLMQLLIGLGKLDVAPDGYKELNSDASPIDMASIQTLKDELELIVSELRLAHAQIFKLEYGNLPAQELGYLSVPLPNGSFFEIDDLETALGAFRIKQEDKAAAKEARDQESAKALLATLARK
jgi:hypothetical protein